MGVGGGLLAAIFLAEAYLQRGFAIPFGLGVFVMIMLCARFFGMVKVYEYCAVTLALTALLLLIGLPK